jgi:hypothetical protein
MVYACKHDEREILIALFTTLFIKFGSVVYLC